LNENTCGGTLKDIKEMDTSYVESCL